MIKSKKMKHLITNQGFFPLVSDQEGKLKGGFALLTSYSVNNCSCETLSNNCQCNGNNCGCPPKMPEPNNCTCGGANNCNCYSTMAPPPTSAPTSVVTVGPDAASVAGYWPGLL